MSTLQLILICINLTQVVFACGVLQWCARHDDPRRRGMWGAISALSLIYVGGYSWLLLGVDRLLWTQVFSGVSLLAWPVWCVPAIVVTRQHLGDVEALRAARLDLP